MKDQHTLISGYRDLSQEEINAMNTIKELAEQVRILVDSIGDSNEFFIDTRWQAIARTDLQKGFMALVRAVAKPETF